MGLTPDASEKYRLFVAIQYLNASDALFAGLTVQQGKNDFHFLVTLRSFIEYTRRGIWFLAWATDKQVQAVKKLTFERSGSPGLAAMDSMIREALGLGRSSPLVVPVKEIDEPFIDLLHALTHGNPIAVRSLGFGLDEIFNTSMLLLRAEADLHLFRILLYRRLLGEELKEVWKILAPLHDELEALRTNARMAAQSVKDSGVLHSVKGWAAVTSETESIFR